MSIDDELEKYGVWIRRGPMDCTQEDAEPLELVSDSDVVPDIIPDDILQDEIPEEALEMVPDEMQDPMREEVRSVLVRLDQLLAELSQKSDLSAERKIKS